MLSNFSHSLYHTTFLLSKFTFPPKDFHSCFLLHCPGLPSVNLLYRSDPGTCSPRLELLVYRLHILSLFILYPYFAGVHSYITSHKRRKKTEKTNNIYMRNLSFLPGWETKSIRADLVDFFHPHCQLLTCYTQGDGVEGGGAGDCRVC